MTKVIELSDEEFETLLRAAQARGETPQRLVVSFVEGLRDPYTQPRYYETDDYLRRLGASDEEIDELNREIAEEEAKEAAPHADA